MSIAISSASRDIYNAYLTKKVADDQAGSAITQKYLSHIKNYGVTEKVDISKIDDAIKKVSDARVSLGTQTISVEFRNKLGNVSAEHMESSKSSIESLDTGPYVSEQKKGDIIQQYQYFVIEQNFTQQQDMVSKLLGV